MTGMVKIKTKENGSIIKIHTVYRTIQPNNPTTYMGKIDVYIYPFFCCKQYDGGNTFIGIYTSYKSYLWMRASQARKNEEENNPW